MPNTLRQRFEEKFPLLYDCDTSWHNITDSVWSFIETIREEALKEWEERAKEKIKELYKFDFLPVQVKEENPIWWELYETGMKNFYEKIISSL